MRKFLLYAMPKRALTTLVGAFSKTELSKWLIPLYVKHYQIDVGEAAHPPHHYDSLVQFFSRRLKPETRPIHPGGVVSPVDATVSELGTIHKGLLLQAKGCTYSFESLLGGKDLARDYADGSYVTLYLSPRDYHRIHMPINGVLRKYRYIPGNLYPVNRHGVRHIAGLFTKNERLVTTCTTEVGKMAVVMVGATIVGSIRTDYGPGYHPAIRRRRLSVMEEVLELPKRRGEELGYFEFGSTVILLFSAGMIDGFTVHTGDFVKMGERIAQVSTVHV